MWHFRHIIAAAAVAVAATASSSSSSSSSSSAAATAPGTAGRLVRVDAGALVCDAFAFGAVGDGIADDTAALQRAISACAAAPGGGTALLPSNGTFLSFALLAAAPPSSAGFALRVEGVLRFSNDTKAWAKLGAAACLTVAGSGVAVVGHGTIDGQGAAWWPCAKAGCPRPNLLNAKVSGGAGLLIANLTFIDSPNHNLELYASPQEVFNVSILAPDSAGVPVPSHNTDGIDVHGSPALIHGCKISVGDDHVAMHANDTLVERCRFGTGHGASIGSLGPGTALQNITVRDCSFEGAATAMRIKADSVSSGFLRDVTYANLTLADCAETLLVTENYPSSGGESRSTLLISGVLVADVAASGAVAAAGAVNCSASAPCFVTVRNVTHAAPPRAGWQCEWAHGAAEGVTPPLRCLLPPARRD
jgi:polygalacturonase